MALLGALSVFVGWITAVALVVAARSMIEYPLLQTAGLEAGSPVPATYLWMRVAYGAAGGLSGGFVTAWLAPRARGRLVFLLALLVAVPATLYALPERSGEPAGYEVASVLVPALAVLAGAWFRTRIDAGDEPPARTPDGRE